MSRIRTIRKFNFFNQINGFDFDQKQNSDNIRNCNYNNMDQIQSLNKVNDEIYPSFISMHVPFKNRKP